MDREIKTGANSTYKKLAVQWLNEHLCFVSSSVVADSFRLRNRQLLVAAKRHRCNSHLVLAKTRSCSEGLAGIIPPGVRRLTATKM
jgi:hypothetical protein